jgi:glycosyltransferase involved in cell wall biosynthesis
MIDFCLRSVPEAACGAVPHTPPLHAMNPGLPEASLHPLHRLWQRLPAGPRRRMLAHGTALLAPRPDFPAPAVRGGVAVAGELSRASGLGEAARIMRRAIEGIGLPTWAIDLDAPGAVELPAGVPLLLHVNAPLLPLALLRAPRSLVRGRRVIGYWAWELPTVPDTWRAGLPFVHEIWALSSFTAEAFRNWLPTDAAQPVRTVPIPLAVAPPVPAALDRAAFGLPAEAVVVLVSCNLASSFERKNPLGAIAAFKQAFGDRPDRLLLLKLGNPEHAPADFAAVRQAVAEAANIRIDTRILPIGDSHALTACADLVLSMHRSEGFGLVPAEAMLLGRAVIATGWSGNMDFMDADSAALVGYRLVPARDPRGVFEAPGARWAEPDIGEAAAHLRHLADDPAGRAALAERGRRMAYSRLGDEPLRQALRGVGLGLPA